MTRRIDIAKHWIATHLYPGRAWVAYVIVPGKGSTA